MTLGTGEEIFAGETADPYLLAVRAYVWGLAPVVSARLRELLTNPSDPDAPRLPTSAGAPLNNIGHQRRLSDPTLPGVAPNVDTLYTLAWLDLADEPFVLETPDFGSRYYCIQIGHADTASELSLGTRTHGSQLPPLFIHGPDGAAAPAGTIDVPSHTRYVMVAGRVLVQPDDSGDFDAVRELQEQIRLRPLGKYLDGETGRNEVREQRLLNDGDSPLDARLATLAQLGNVLRNWWVSPGEERLLKSFGAIGLTPEQGFDADALTGEAKAEVARGLADAAEAVDRKTRALGSNANGWTTNYRGPRFGDDYLLRAAVARDQPYVNVPEEALYPVAAIDADGRPLERRERLPHRLPVAVNAAGGRVLVADDVHAGRPAARAEPDRPVRDRRSHAGPRHGPRRRARDPRSARAARGGNPRELAAGAAGAVPPDAAPVHPAGARARRIVGAAADPTHGGCVGCPA